MSTALKYLLFYLLSVKGFKVLEVSRGFIAPRQVAIAPLRVYIQVLGFFGVVLGWKVELVLGNL
jgi:hypothetical protein